MRRIINFHHRGSEGDTRPVHLIDETISSSNDRSKPVTRASSDSSGIPFADISLRPRDHERGLSTTDTESQSVSHSKSQSHDCLGLHLVCDNANPRGDIIFVHGLGGSDRKTWSWNHDAEYFWPSWLADEEELSSYRIFTFGYNSNFRGAGTNLNIIDFAKDLLFQMLTFSGRLEGDGGEHIPIGHRAIVFICHSMGGLVVKKACILGKYDNEYASLISRIYGIVFLATPHRGAQYAKMLNNILATSPLGPPPKTYLAELDTRSGTLQDINEQFRKVCDTLALVSFFETLKTNFGVTKKIIVEKESGILGYPQEISSPLNADHHTICKFKNREDANYVIVKNTLKLWASRLHPTRPNFPMKRSISNLEWIKRIEAVLGIRESPENELTAFRNKAMDGTSLWITRRRDYIDWIQNCEEPQRPRLFWLIGLPATGKTVLASVVINHLQLHGEECQYHFFNSGHQAKQTVAYCLRSIASQLVRTNEEFRDKLFTLHEEYGIAFTSQNQNFGVIWEKIFEGIIFKMRFKKPLFWVLDAVDEADSQSLIISHLMKMQSLTPIRVFLTSRPIKVPPVSLAHGSSITTCFLSEFDTMEDIRAYVHNAVRAALPDDEFVQDDVIDQILRKASGSFLWVKLALETLQENWHTQDDIYKALTEVPKGMEPLYQQMLGIIEGQSPRLQLIANRILTWTACSWRPLSITELQVALEPEFKGFVSLEDTIVRTCGHFISVDNSKVTLIHMTARDFLLGDRNGTPAFVNSKYGHEGIAIFCLKYLSNHSWKRVFKSVENSMRGVRKKPKTNGLLLAEKDHPALGYATCYWAYHVSKSNLDSQILIESLETFFTRYCLSWIEAIALSGNLRYLIRSAQYLKAFAKRRSRSLKHKTLDLPLSLKDPPEDYAKNIQLWANDFIRIVGKFGSNLVQSPSSIHRLVPLFCPRGSMIGETYATSKEKLISVAGLSADGWDDCLASVNVGKSETASTVLATDAYFATLIKKNGTIVIWYSQTCEMARKMHHDEYVSLMTLNNAHNLLATAGVWTYRVWEISSGKELYRLPKKSQSLTMVISFGCFNLELFVGLDDCSVTCYDLETAEQKSRFVARNSQDNLQGCPRVMALSPDLRNVAIAWRGNPPVIWDMTASQFQHPQRCRIAGRTDSICAPEQIEWQKDGNSILVLCQGTKLVEWHIYDEEQIEFDHIKPRDMTISQDGNLLLTSDSMGTMSIWTFPRLNLIYQLTNENEFIRNLVFSPDGQRFYDTRESQCNVWEPDALVRPDEHDLEDQSSVAGSSTVAEPIISYDERSQSQVTALASDSKDKYYCCGREDGSVMIHDAVDGSKLRKAYSHGTFSSVILLMWSASGKYMVSCDDSGRVLAKRLEGKEVGKWSVFPLLDFRLDEPVQQFLFSGNETLLLVSTSSTDCIWDLKAKNMLCHRHWGSQQSRRWIEHPLNTELLLWIDPAEVHTHSWRTLEDKSSIEKSSSRPGTPVLTSCQHHSFAPASAHEKLVHWISLTGDKRYLVYETLPVAAHTSTRSSSGLHLEFLSTSSLRIQHPQSFTSDCMADLEGQVKRLIGIHEDKIVFLNYDYWLCTWKIDAGADDVRKHFFLPKDWLNTGGLQMAMLNAQGTFFCPKHGNVAIVRHGMRL